MTIDELKTYVRTMLNAAFPAVAVQFERISDDSFHVVVAVYGVDPVAVKWVKDKILDIDEKLCANTDFVLTPLVRDEATTEKYYPEFVSAWKIPHALATDPLIRQLQAEVQTDTLETFLHASESEWQRPESPHANAANQELALAA